MHGLILGPTENFTTASAIAGARQAIGQRGGLAGPLRFPLPIPTARTRVCAPGSAIRQSLRFNEYGPFTATTTGDLGDEERLCTS